MAAANLVIDEGRTVLARSGEEIIDLLKGGQGVLNIVPMAGVVSELDGRHPRAWGWPRPAPATSRRRPRPGPARAPAG